MIVFLHKASVGGAATDPLIPINRHIAILVCIMYTYFILHVRNVSLINSLRRFNKHFNGGKTYEKEKTQAIYATADHCCFIGWMWVIQTKTRGNRDKIHGIIKKS